MGEEHRTQIALQGVFLGQEETEKLVVKSLIRYLHRRKLRKKRRFATPDTRRGWQGTWRGSGKTAQGPLDARFTSKIPENKRKIFMTAKADSLRSFYQSRGGSVVDPATPSSGHFDATAFWLRGRDNSFGASSAIGVGQCGRTAPGAAAPSGLYARGVVDGDHDHRGVDWLASAGRAISP
jgi:hypothetical protein